MSITVSATRSDNGAKPFGSRSRDDDGVISIEAARGVEQRELTSLKLCSQVPWEGVAREGIQHDNHGLKQYAIKRYIFDVNIHLSV